MLQCGSRHCLFMPEVAEKEIEIHSLLNFSSTTIIYFRTVNGRTGYYLKT